MVTFRLLAEDMPCASIQRTMSFTSSGAGMGGKVSMTSGRMIFERIAGTFCPPALSKSLMHQDPAHATRWYLTPRPATFIFWEGLMTRTSSLLPAIQGVPQVGTHTPIYLGIYKVIFLPQLRKLHHFARRSLRLKVKIRHPKRPTIQSSTGIRRVGWILASGSSSHSTPR